MIYNDKLENQRLWQKRIDDHAKSQMPQTTSCLENNINLHNFKYWRSRLKDTEKNKTEIPQFVEKKPFIPHQSILLIFVIV